MPKIILEFDLKEDDQEQALDAIKAGAYKGALDDVDQNVFRHLLKYESDNLLKIAGGASGIDVSDLIEEDQQKINSLLYSMVELLRGNFHSTLENWGVSL